VINTRIIASAIVQIVAIICPSRMNRLVCLFWMILIIVYNTVMMIINKIIKACSLKKISCSMTGDTLHSLIKANVEHMANIKYFEPSACI